MEFRLLGPLEIHDGERTVSIPAPKQRALLAFLLLHRDEAVPLARLTEALWEDTPPATATKAIQVYIAQLRKTIGDGLLVTENGGYAAVMNGHRMDVDRFERLLGEGQRHLESGDPETASRVLGDALGLWYGAPLSDLPHTHAIRDHVARLEEQRMCALEGRIDADLALGRHLRLVPELQELVARHPLRERLRAQLMLALYGCGRQADALAAYREGRRLLVDELGIEPGVELQELERAILTQDATLGAPAGPPRTPARRRRRRAAAAMVGGGVLAAASALALLLTSGGAMAPPPVQGDAVAALDARTGDVVARVAVGRSPTTVAAGAGGVWVLNADDKTITRIDGDGRSQRTLGIGAAPTDVAVGLGSVWIGNGGPVGRAQFAGQTATALTQLDPATGGELATVPLPRPRGVVSNVAEQHVAFADGAVWAINPDFSVSRIDPSTRRVVAVVRGVLAVAIAAADDDVWVLGDDRKVARIDTETNRVARRIRVRATQLDSIALGGGSVWATDPASGVLWKIDRGAQRAIDVGAGAGGVAFGAGAAWVSNGIDGTVKRVDPATGAVTRTWRLGGAPRGLAVSGDRVWVALAADVAPARAVARGAVEPVGSTACGPVLAGAGTPALLVVSDLPLTGGTRIPGRQMSEAVLHVLRERGFRAGRFALAYQSCDDSVARVGLFDPAKCAANAKAYARTPRLVGIVGPMNSGCAAPQIPILRRAGLAMVSPMASEPGLTRPPGGPERSFARLLTPDDANGAAQAILAHRLGARRPYVVHDGGYGATVALPAARALERLGTPPAGIAQYDYQRRRYASLAARVRRSGADAVVLCGLLDTDAGAVLAALRRELGGDAPIIGCEGLLPTALLFQRAGSAAAGTYLTISGRTNERLPTAGRAFVRRFGATQGGTAVAYASVYAAQATEVLLTAIARSDGTRASVREALMSTRIGDGLIGSFAIDPNGDPDPATVTVLRAERPGTDLRVLAHDGARVVDEIEAPWRLWGGL
jgi:DNA-binding SARP family transcriptional activator/ABC-type branched-subunit amino acid transport system substrate-binding protein